MADTKQLKPLTKKHEKVLNEYIVCFNQWRAYKAAFPKVTDESARSLSSILFADVNFAGHLAARLDEVHMTADEALKRMADIARGDITEFITPFGAVDLEAMKAAGKGHLIKKIKQRTITRIGKSEDDEDTETHDTEIELYPADSALRDVLKIHGKYKDTLELPETLKIQIVRASDADSN